MWFLFKFVSLAYFFASSFVWWSFLIPRNIFIVLINILLLGSLYCCHFKLKITRRSVSLFGILFLLTAFSTYIIHLSYGILTFFSYLPAILLFILPNAQKLDLLSFTTKWYGILIGIAICIYGFTSIVGGLPSFGKFEATDLNYPPYDNFIFFIKQQVLGETTYRFNGPFLEPGHQAMISGILLFANKFQFKEKPILWIILVAVLLSLSLAGYVILIIGFLLLYIRSVSKLIGIGIGAVIITFFVTDIWNNGDNPVNLLIFSRLQYDDEKGISGNNRTIAQTDFYFDKCVKDGTVWLGVRTLKEESLKIRGAGYKIFLLRYGIVSLALVALFYLLLITPGSNRRYAYSFFILMAFIFLQRAYPGWYSWLLPYVLGIGCTTNNAFFQPNRQTKLKNVAY